MVLLLQDHPSVAEGLDLIEEGDQFTHMLTLDDAVNDERMLGQSHLAFAFASQVAKHKWAQSPFK